MDNVMIYPLLFAPVLKDYLWGGRNLERLLGRKLPPGITAESWEIAAHKDGTTMVENGYFAGQPLTAVQEKLGLDLLGRRNTWAYDRGKFPLLIKLLDANQPLSVQVHPNDDYALTNEGNELGKTEMWVVLHAEHDAALILGLQDKVSPELFRKAINEGSLNRYLHRLPIFTGDTVCVPAGTLHAILEGSVIAEIQQNSNTTYRVYDWNRVDADGNPRTLHVDKAVDVIDFSIIKPGKATPKIVYDDGLIRRSLLCSNSYFTTERVEFADQSTYEGHCNGETLEIWGVIQGKATVDDIQMEAVRFALLPAALGKFSIEAVSGSVLLRTFVG
jgi:mannose-6-phosphate isomerase